MESLPGERSAVRVSRRRQRPVEDDPGDQQASENEPAAVVNATMAPDREIAPRADLLDQTEIHQFGDELVRGAALQVGGQDDSAILPCAAPSHDYRRPGAGAVRKKLGLALVSAVIPASGPFASLLFPAIPVTPPCSLFREESFELLTP